MEGTRWTGRRILSGSLPHSTISTPHYTTNEPYLASFVLCEGAGLAGCSRLGPKKVEFRFVADLEVLQDSAELRVRI